MAKAVIMPKFGFTQETATIVRWIVQEGDTVEPGDPLAEVTTDKINMEVEAPVGGVIAGMRFPAGAEVPVTEVIVSILAPGESLPPEAAANASAAVAGLPAPTQGLELPAAGHGPVLSIPPVQATPVARRMAQAEGVDLAALAGSGPGGLVTREDVADFLQGRGSDQGKVRATPAARRIARAQGVDLRSIQGTGLAGRVQGSDVAAYAAALPAAQPVALVVQPPVAAVGPAGGQARPAAASPDASQPQVIPLEGMRLTIARRMQSSAQQAPHIYLTLDIEMSRAERMRAAFNARQLAGSAPLSMTAILLKATAAALVEHPRLNSYLQNDQLLVFPQVNLGVAVALEDGLIVPVVRNAAELPLVQLGVELADLSRRARAGKLRPEEVMDGTFTVSNLGMFGIDHFTAILNPPQVAILAVGRIARRFVPGEDDRPVARSLMTVTLSCDHRAVDGAQGASFLQTLKGILETAGSQWG